MPHPHWVRASLGASVHRRGPVSQRLLHGLHMGLAAAMRSKSGYQGKNLHAHAGSGWRQRMAKKQPLPGAAVACVASAPLPESGSVRPFNFQSTSFGTVCLAIPLERKQDSVTIRNGSSFPGWCLRKVVLLKRHP